MYILVGGFHHHLENITQFGSFAQIGMKINIFQTTHPNNFIGLYYMYGIKQSGFYTLFPDPRSACLRRFSAEAIPQIFGLTKNPTPEAISRCVGKKKVVLIWRCSMRVTISTIPTWKSRFGAPSHVLVY